MSAKPVGLLWDSVSNNTGDIAVGMVLKRFCEVRNIPHEAADPFGYDPANYSTFIVGGGQLLRQSGDIFYQNFRIPGPHILNAVGIHHPDHLDYLKEYRLVSVRSLAEKAQITQDVPGLNIEVRPCLTTQFEKYFQSEINQARNNPVILKGAVGIHLNNTTLRMVPNLFSSLERLNKKYPIVFIPFTHYENDRYLMETLAKWLPRAVVSPANDPVAIFAGMGNLQALISSSMHAALFAYVQNVPVLAFPQDYKIRYFFEERSFPQSLYTSSENLLTNLEALLENPPDYRQSAETDKALVDEHLEKVARIVGQPVEYSYPDRSLYTDKRYNELRRSFYLDVMQKYYESNTQTTQMMDLRFQIDQLPKNNSVLSEREASPESLVPTGRQQFSRGLFKLRKLLGWKKRQYISLIKSSDLFDESWYLQHYPDVAAAKMDPALHYLYYGGFEGRDPGPSFSSSGYLTRYDDVRDSMQNPLVHYLQFGKSESRIPKPIEA